MPELYDKEFIQRFLSGKCPAEEREAFQRFLRRTGIPKIIANGCTRFGKRQETIIRFILVRKNEYSGASYIKLPDLQPKINVSVKAENSFKSIIKDHFHTHYTWRYASIIILFMVASLALNGLMLRDAYKPQIIANIERSTHNGQHLTLVLEDGTKN
ncbi:MAG: hypothetical protein U5K79_11900 [Cyclobacteriaceae bacterium]|nr:hypothetical protein [Cyclobacteriaceae bacterium]